MNDAKEQVVVRLNAFQVAIDGMSGADKVIAQRELDALVQALVDANACGPLRRGYELVRPA